MSKHEFNSDKGFLRALSRLAMILGNDFVEINETYSHELYHKEKARELGYPSKYGITIERTKGLFEKIRLTFAVLIPEDTKFKDRIEIYLAPPSPSSQDIALASKYSTLIKT